MSAIASDLCGEHIQWIAARSVEFEGGTVRAVVHVDGCGLSLLVERDSDGELVAVPFSCRVKVA